MKKKKILFFLQTLNGGGAERVTVNIIKGLDRDKFEVILLLVNREGVYLDLIPKDVSIYSLDSSKTLFSILKLRKKIKEIKPDIIYSTLYRTHIALYLALIGISHKPKSIMRMPNSPKLVLENRQISSINRFLLEIALKNSDLVLAQTPEMKEEIAHFHKIDKDKIEVLLNPLDKELIDKSIENVSNPFNRDYINIVASGRITHQKGFDILIKAFAKLYDYNSKYRLHIIGADREGKLKEYKKLSLDLGVGEYISFLGFQKNPYRYYYYADIFVLSSRWEGLPNTVLENLYLNKIVVATKCIPYMSELIKEGENGFLAEVEDPKSLYNAILKAEKIDKNSLKKSNLLEQNFDKVFDI